MNGKDMQLFSTSCKYSQHRFSAARVSPRRSQRWFAISCI
jgi:hypothetical protein